MAITKTNRPTPLAIVHVTGVEPLHDYVLRLEFDDGSERIVDLEEDLWGEMFEPLRDLSLFRQVAVDDEAGTIAWPNGADMDPIVLHGDAEPARLDSDT